MICGFGHQLRGDAFNANTLMLVYRSYWNTIYPKFQAPQLSFRIVKTTKIC